MSTAHYARAAEIELKLLDEPIYDEGACPFECCVYDKWDVQKDVLVFPEIDANQSMAVLKVGHTVEALSGTVVNTQVAEISLIKDTVFYEINADAVTFPIGTKIKILHPIGEGAWRVQINGGLYNSSIEIEKQLGLKPGQLSAENIKFKWWSLVNLKKILGNKTGWVDMDTASFAGVDQCS